MRVIQRLDPRQISFPDVVVGTSILISLPALISSCFPLFSSACTRKLESLIFKWLPDSWKASIMEIFTKTINFPEEKRVRDLPSKAYFNQSSPLPAVMIMATQLDHNQAFSQLKHFMDPKRFDIVYKQPSSMNALCGFLNETVKRIDTLIIAAHGSPHGMLMAPGFFLQCDDFKNAPSSCFEQIDRVILLSCSTAGPTTYGSDNVATCIARATRKPVIAATAPVAQIGLLFDTEGDLGKARFVNCFAESENGDLEFGKISDCTAFYNDKKIPFPIKPKNFNSSLVQSSISVYDFIKYFLNLPKSSQTLEEAKVAFDIDPRIMFQKIRPDLVTLEMAKEAIRAAPGNFWHVKNKTREITDFAINHTPFSSTWIQLRLFKLFKM